jgi:hypothetical protein
LPAASSRSCRLRAIPDHRTVNARQIEFKKFGVGLNFTPVVMSEGRISLKVMTEVSELSTDNARSRPVEFPFRPSIDVRRADTTVEIPSGGALAHGRHDSGADQAADQRHAGLMNMPVLGALFKSRDYINRQTELMVHRHALHRARGGAEGSVAAGRRLRRRFRSRPPPFSAASTESTAGPAGTRRDGYRGNVRLHSRLMRATKETTDARQ